MTFTENFNSTNSSFTRSPQSAWMLDTTLSVGGKAAWGFVPNAEGDSIELISPVYDLSNYAYAYLRFAHICKVSEEDLVTVEYKENYVGSKWVPIPYADYKGASQVYRKQRCFHHGAYPEWVKNDMTAQPDNSWWKVESFDISQDVAYAEVQFKFKIKKGSTVGTNFAWGWFIDNFELMASTAQITPPVVQFVAPFTNGTVYGPGPYTIYAKAAKRTIVPLKQPVLRVSYTALSGKITNDSIMMTPYAGDSMWKATIPQQVIGTKVSYTIYAADTVGNSNMASSGYTIGREWGYDSNCVALLSIDTPLVGAIAGRQTPVEVTIQNRGLSNLTSAIINWSVNGVAQNPVKWTGNLNEGFRTRVPLGSYMPAMNKQDTIVASVSMPNGDKINNTKDTIASKKVYGCATIPAGKYMVDPDSTNTTPGIYHRVNDILDAIRICGTSGDIVISLAKGTYYEELELFDFSHYMAPGTSLLIESASGKAEDVIFAGSDPGKVRVRVSNTSNLTIRNITFTGIATGVYFSDTVSNAELSGCRVLQDTKTTTTYVGVLIYQGVFDGIRVLNNYIEGAYYSMYIYGNSTSDYAKNITVMGNRMHASYYYGMYTYYVDFDYVSNNVVTNRTKNASNYYYGLRFYYVDADEIANNRVNIEADYTYGIYTYYFNRDSSRTGLVANNEIIMRTNTTAYGAYVYYSTVEYIHNTIISLGNPGTTYGVYYGAYSGYKVHFYNNNFSCYGKSAYPFYMTGVTTVGTDLLMDYNNYYGPQYVGYAGGARSTLKEWITYCQDVNAANVKPAYINSSKDGRCLYYTGMTCPILTNVPNDITGKVRAGSTSMGCYTQNPVQFDAALLDFHDWKSSVTIGKAETVKVRMMNTGTVTNIVSVQLNMSLNGTVLTPSQWKGSLAPFKDTIVTVGTYVPVSGVNNLTVWITNQNGIAAGDSSASNDTIRTYSFGCKAPMSGTYTVGGKGADYADLDQALEMLASCGADAPVVFALDSGTYEPITLSGSYPGVSGKNTVTITSRSGKASDVVFTGGTPVIGFAAGSSHFRIDRITVDGLNSTTGVQITGAVNDVRITHCNIMMSPTTTATHYGINCSSGTIRDSIWIIGNHVDGGYYGIYFYNGNNTAASGHGRWHRIDSNVISNAYYYSVYAYDADFESFSHNRITDRNEGGNGYFYGLYSYYCNHHFVVGNRIRSMATYHTNSYGLYIYYSNYSTYAQNTTDTTYLLDNEALVRGTSYTYGLYCYYGNMQVMHNSVYAICTGSYGYGIYMYDASPYYAQVRNNNIYVKGGTNYPMYCGGTISYFLLSDNNYYHDGNTNLAYMGSARTSLSQVQTYDATATNLMPEYIDPLTDSRVCGNTGFTAKPVTNVYYQKYGYRDILDTLRPAKDVTRGAYEVAKLNNNAHLVSFTEPSVAVVAKGQTVDVKVLLHNRGENTLTSCTIGWDINGVSQPAMKWTGSLAKGQSVSVKIGSKMVMDSAYVFTAYVSDPNGMKDDLPSDDTVRTEIQGCDMQLTGNFRVGNSKSADMTFERAIQIMEKCGVGGPVTLRIEKGTYKTNLDFSKIIGMSNYTPITITSLTGDSSDVVIEAATEAPTVILAGTKNLTLSHITIKGFVGGKTSTAIRMDGGNKHLTIRGCHLSTATMNSQAVTDVAISSNQPVSPDTVIVIVGNTITGNGGIYLYGNSSTRSNDVRIDSNTILSPYYYAIYTYYYDIRTINANFIHKYPTESQCNYGIYPLGSYGVLDQVTSISFNRVHGAYSNMLYMTNSYSLGVSGSDISRPILINNNEFICSGSHTGYNFTLWNSGGYLIIAHNTFVIPQGASRTYMISMYTYNPGHFQFFNNNLVNYGNCTNIYYTNWATQNTYMDVWDYNNYWIGNGQFNMNGATTKTVAGFSSILQGGRDANSTMADPRITYPDSIGKPSVWAGLLCASSSYAPTDILGLQRSSMTYKGCYTETFNLDAALLNFVEPKDESVVAGTTTPVKVKLMNVGADTIKSLTIRWTVDGVAQTPVSLTNMNLASYESREVALGSFVPGSNQNIASIVAWCENPNGRLDNNTSTDTITKRLIVCGKALSGNYIIGSSSKADFVSTTEAVSMLNYCGVSGPVVFSIEAGSYPAMELGKIPGSSTTNTVTFISASGNRDAVVIGEGASPALKMENTSHVTFRNVTIGSATNAANQVAVQFMGYIENVLFHHCNLYVQASTTNSSSHVVDYNNTGSTVNYLKDVRFIGNEVRGGYYGFYLNYAGGAAALCKTSAVNRASVRIDSNYIYDQYYYPVYSYYYTYIPSFSHNTIKSRLGASYNYGAYFYYYNLVDSVVGNKIHVNVSSYAYGGIRLYYYINYTSTFGSDIVPAIVANNEIISVAGTTAYGIYAYNYVN
ncbi:MAG: right-handed parallel beta-helix repeat-containing protein, partial [Bacteroidales bacterium]|nr:right-handed parallel beta-helix repeat-containing protein [Bacteroidales bacterium]